MVEDAIISTLIKLICWKNQIFQHVLETSQVPDVLHDYIYEAIIGLLVIY